MYYFNFLDKKSLGLYAAVEHLICSKASGFFAQTALDFSEVLS
jgi:hypothetical protein